MGAAVLFNDYAFDNTGIPQWGRRIDFEQQGDGLPRLARSTYTVKQTFTEQSFADNEAQIHLLAEALKAGEGLLVIKDENGTELVRQVVTVKSHNVPESWRQYVADVTVTFEGRDLVSANQADASFTPSGGAAIALTSVQDWKQSTDISRFNDERANRREVKVSITASGFILADKTLSVADRRAALKTLAASMRVCSAKEGQLAFGGETNLVMVDRFDADIGDGSERLNWSLSCFFKIFPLGTNYAEADYSISTRDDFSSGRRVIAIRGNIRAENETAGKAKAEAIRLQYAASGRRSDYVDLGDARLDGVDGSVWVDMTFDFQFSEPIPNIRSWELRVSTRDDVKSDDKLITYQGKVIAPTSADAITKARELGLGKYPVMTVSEETVSSSKVGDEDQVFTEVTFSYEYQAKSDWKYAELSREVATDTFGDAREVISGFTVAADETTAKAFAATFKLSGRLMRDQRENSGQRSAQAAGASGVTAQMTRFDFTYSYYLTPATVSASYGREERTDYENAEATINLSGVARGPTEAACRSFIDTLIVGITGLVEKTVTPSFEKQVGSALVGSAGAGAQLISVSFSYRFVSKLTDDQVFQAEYSKRTTFSVNKAVITTIPYGQPYVQPAVGWTPGLVVISGSVSAGSAATAKAWGRGKRGLLGSGGYEDPPEEEEGAENMPHDASNVKKYRFNFTYSARFAYLPFS
jgi:hypothetical protein